MSTCNRFYFFFIVWMLFAGTSLYGQSSKFAIDTILNKIELSRLTHPSGCLYLHLDKTIYTNNEDVWFTAYLLNSASPAKHTTLSVALVNDNDRHVALESLFVITDGLAFGHLTLPDTISPGSYHLLAYTNVLDRHGNPGDVFSQPITVKSTGEAAFSASIKLTDTARDAAGNLHALIRVTNKDPKAKLIAGIQYSFGQQTGIAKTDVSGEYKLTIPGNSGNLLRVAVKQAKQLQFLSLKLPVVKIAHAIRFYPEGGNMIEGITNLVGWEARSATGGYVKLSAILLKNDVPIDTVETNSYGIGKFRLAPERGCRYALRIATAGVKKDTLYKLPPALSDGIVMHLVKALAEDTLAVQLKSTKQQRITLLVHNYQRLIASQELILKPFGSIVKILLNEAPKGLATVTVLDSLGRPLAERLFFAHYLQKNLIGAETNNEEYAPREKVTLKLKLTNKDGIQTNGIVSVACVQDNRVESAKQTDITTYTYLKHDLQQLPPDPLGKNYENPDYVQDLLLVKGWRRYTWANLLNTTTTDTLRIDSLAQFQGTITINNKPLKKAVNVAITGGPGFQTTETDKRGRFEPSVTNLLTVADKKLTLMAADKHPEIFELSLNDPYKNINKKLATELVAEAGGLITEFNTRSQVMDGFQKTISLNEVVIKGSQNSDNIYGIKWHTNENGVCGDWVCFANTLNCAIDKKESPGSYRPVVGMSYRTAKYGIIVYQGCLLFKPGFEIYRHKLLINGINLPKEFYPIDEALINTTEPEFLSTIYWNYSVPVEADKESTLSFYTGDITGRFRVILQGATATEVISKQLFFNVKKN